MFPYFGRKSRIARLYGAPRYSTVIEPFAGSLGYSLHWKPQQALGFEKDVRVVALWNRLRDMREIPVPPVIGSHTTDLMVMLCSYSEHALTSNQLTVTSRMLRDWQFVHQRALDAQAWVQHHADYRQGSYLDTPDTEATWFIDPPYQHANRRGYREGAGGIDFGQLAEWVKSRRGQVIVCEQEGATWLPFKSLVSIASHRGAVSREVVWTNQGLSTPSGASSIDDVRDGDLATHQQGGHQK